MNTRQSKNGKKSGQDSKSGEIKEKNTQPDVSIKNEIDIVEEPLQFEDDSDGEIFVLDGLEGVVVPPNEGKKKLKNPPQKKRQKEQSKNSRKKLNSNKLESEYNFLWIVENVKSELDAATFLQTFNIIPHTKMCKNEHAMILYCENDAVVWRCKESDCVDEDISVRTGTWLEDMKVSLTIVLLFIYSWTKEYTSIRFCEKELEMNKDVAEDFNNFLSEVCTASLSKHPASIGGEGLTVEIDETYFKRKNNRKALPRLCVFGGVCRETKDVFLYAIPDRNEETLVTIIKKSIKPGTTIISGASREYKNIDNIPGYNYKHLVVNHGENLVDATTRAHTQNISNTWSHLKHGNKKHSDEMNQGNEENEVESYLCEFMWRKRNVNLDIFINILRDIAEFGNNKKKELL